MSAEATWQLNWKWLDKVKVSEALTQLALVVEGLTFEVEVEDRECISAFLHVQGIEIELSFYDLDSDGRVLSLEPEWADNREHWEAAMELAEELADILEAEHIDL
jgi:hypothetical protein